MPIQIGTPTTPTPVTDAITPDGYLRATVLADVAGVFLRADFSSVLTDPAYAWPNPFTVSVYRVTSDGTISVVRGAGNISQYGGILHAYDDEVPFGQIVAYYAVAFTQDGEPGITTQNVAVTTWEPEGGFVSPGVWIKNLEDPVLSCPARVQDWSAFSYGSRNSVADVWGSPFPGVVSDVRKAPSSQITFLTKDEDEYQALLEACSASVVFIVGLVRHRRRTGYYVIGDLGSARVGHDPSTGYDTWTVPVQQMGNPPTAGQSLVVPGRSYADRRAAHELYEDVSVAGPSYGPAAYNMVLNPSMDTNLLDTQTYLSASRAQVATDYYSGTGCVQVTHTAAGDAGSSWTISPAVTGQTLQAGVWVKVPAAVTAIRLVWRSGTTLLHTQTLTVPAAGVWTRLTGSYAVGAAEVCDRIGVAATGASGTVWLADAVMAEVGSSLNDYGDGNSESWKWLGTAGDSPSIKCRTYGAGTEPYTSAIPGGA